MPSMGCHGIHTYVQPCLQNGRRTHTHKQHNNKFCCLQYNLDFELYIEKELCESTLEKLARIFSVNCCFSGRLPFPRFLMFCIFPSRRSWEAQRLGQKSIMNKYRRRLHDKTQLWFAFCRFAISARETDQ